jgi:amidase
LQQLIDFNKATPSELQFFGQESFEKSLASPAINDAKYLSALKMSKQLAGQEGLAKLLSANKLDALVAPTTAAAWRVDSLNGDHYGGSFTTLPAVSGYPHLTVPMGAVRDLPLGISFIGMPFSEPTLLALGFAFEAHAKARVPPKFLPSIDFTERATK